MISVLITTYNKPEHFKKALKSWSEQAIRPEIIVSNDGGDHYPTEIARELGIEIKYVWQPDEGYRLASSMNNGISLVTNDVLIKADDDIVVPPNFSDRVLGFMKDNPGMIYIPTMPFAEFHTHRVLHPDQREIKPNSYIGFWGGCFAVPMSIFDEIGYFDTRYDGHWGAEDTDFAYRAVRNAWKLHHGDEVVLHLEHPKGFDWQKDQVINRQKMLDKFGLKELK